MEHTQSENPVLYRAKHPAKLHCWAGVSSRGATKLIIFDGSVRMDAPLYIEILRAGLLPFMEEKYGGN